MPSPGLPNFMDLFFHVFYYKIPRLESNSNLTQWFPNCNDKRDFPEVILCLFEYFGCQNIIKATTNVGKVVEKYT